MLHSLRFFFYSRLAAQQTNLGYAGIDWLPLPPRSGTVIRSAADLIDEATQRLATLSMAGMVSLTRGRSIVPCPKSTRTDAQTGAGLARSLPCLP